MSTLNVDTIADEAGTGGPDFAGMPTVAGDPVVESGSNSDGEWTRFADGTQIVRAEVVSTTSIPTAFFGGFRSAGSLRNFPAAFIDGEARVVCSPLAGTGFGAVVFDSPSSTQATFVLTSVTSAGTVERRLAYTAAGRWK